MESTMSRVLLLLLAVAGQAAGQDPAATLTGVHKTPHFEIRFRPGSRAEASVDRVAVAAEADLATILAKLALPDFKHVIRLFLYEDVPELQKVTGAMCAGFSVPLASHVPHDNDQTRLHELVHVVAEKLPEKGPESRNLFFAEGLANAVLGFVHGVHVDAVAAFYRKRGELPSLAEVHAIPDFYAWLRKHPGVNGYDIGGSWFAFLLDTHGALKTRKYYCGVPAREAFGTDLPALEKAWHARLDKVVLRPGTVALLEERANVPGAAIRRSPEAKLTEAILGPPSAWKALVRPKIVAGDPGAILEDAIVLTGEKSQGDWSVARIADEAVGDAMVRCRAEPLEGCFGVQIQFGPACQGMVLRGQGAFVYGDRGAVSHDPAVEPGEKGVEIVLRRRNGRATLWIDGALAGEGEVPASAAALGVGCVGGKARITKLAIRRL
jgi:hypothetical protein